MTPRRPGDPAVVHDSSAEGRPLFAGRFEVIGSLGEGGFGTVYLAWDRRLGREVALKCVLAEVLARPDARARFLREARSLAAVSHPNVVTIYDVGEAEGRLFLCLERIHGATLRELLARGPFEIPAAIAIGRSVLSGLGAIHRAGIVHRDVKPGNVMLDPDGRVKLMDFGLAKDAKGRSDLTGKQLTPGTPLYMAPEQWLQEPVTAATDVFALGAVLYETVAGKPPFHGETVDELADAILYGRLEPLSAVRPGVPAALEEIVRRALQKDPVDRFPSVAEMRSALAPFAPSGDATTHLRQHAPVAEARPARALPVESSDRTLPPPKPAARPGRRRTRLGVGIGALAAIALAFALVPKGGSLEVEVRSYRIGREGREERLFEGATVRSGEDIYFEVKPSEDVHLYLVNRDSSERYAALFPSREMLYAEENPFEAGRFHRFPPRTADAERGNLFRLDEVEGEEVFYLFARRKPWIELETLMQGMHQGGPAGPSIPRGLAFDLRGFEAQLDRVRGVQSVVADRRVAASPPIAGSEEDLRGRLLVGDDAVLHEIRLDHR